MGDKKDVSFSGFGFPIYLVIQGGLVAVKETFGKTIPGWIIWLPSLIILGVVALIIAVILLIAIVIGVWGLIIMIQALFERIKDERRGR